MPPSEQFSFRELLRSIFSDPWRKIAAVGLAVVLWHYLDSQVTATDDLPLELVAAHEAGDLDTSLRDPLFVRLDLTTYSVIDYEDPSTGDPIDNVSLVVSGAKQLIQTLDENPGYSVRVLPVFEQGEHVAMFDAEALQPLNPAFSGLVVRMTPPRVRVRIGENIARAIRLVPERIDTTLPPGTAGLAERLVWPDAKFEHQVVTLRGPRPLVEGLASNSDALYDFRPQTTDVGERQVAAPIVAREREDGVSVEPTTMLLEVPLRVNAKVYRLPGVAVQLIEPPSVQGQFEPAKAIVDVEIEVQAGQLEARLSGKNPAELQEWVRANCLLVAWVPPDASVEDVTSKIRLLIKESDRDSYRMAQPVGITFVPKNP